MERKIELTVNLDEQVITDEVVKRAAEAIANNVSGALLRRQRGWGNEKYVPTEETERIVKDWLTEHQDDIIAAVSEKVVSKMVHSNPLRERIAQLVANAVLHDEGAADQSGLESAT